MDRICCPGFASSPKLPRCNSYACSSSYAWSPQPAAHAVTPQPQQHTGPHRDGCHCSLCVAGSCWKCLCLGPQLGLSHAFWPCSLHWLLGPCCQLWTGPCLLGHPCMQYSPHDGHSSSFAAMSACVTHNTVPHCMYSRPYMTMHVYCGCVYHLFRFTGLEAGLCSTRARTRCTDCCSCTWLQAYARTGLSTGLSSCSCIWQAYHCQTWPHKQPAPQQVLLQSVRTSIHRVVTVLTDMTEASPPVCLTHNALPSLHERHH